MLDHPSFPYPAVANPSDQKWPLRSSKVVRLGWQELDSWVVLDRVQADLWGAVVEGVARAAAVAPAEASWTVAAAVVQGSEVQAVILGLENFLVERQVRPVCHLRSVVPC